MGKLRIVKDFLPPPDQLTLKEDKVKVTVSLSKASVDFFKREAEKHHTSPEYDPTGDRFLYFALSKNCLTYHFNRPHQRR